MDWTMCCGGIWVKPGCCCPTCGERAENDYEVKTEKLASILDKKFEEKKEKKNEQEEFNF